LYYCEVGITEDNKTNSLHFTRQQKQCTQEENILVLLLISTQYIQTQNLYSLCRI